MKNNLIRIVEPKTSLGLCFFYLGWAYYTYLFLASNVRGFWGFCKPKQKSKTRRLRLRLRLFLRLCLHLCSLWLSDGRFTLCISSLLLMFGGFGYGLVVLENFVHFQYDNTMLLKFGLKTQWLFWILSNWFCYI